MARAKTKTSSTPIADELEKMRGEVAVIARNPVLLPQRLPPLVDRLLAALHELAVKVETGQGG